MEEDQPSKVLHFRNFTPEITQHDIETVAAQFGEIEQTIVMRAKNQCLVQFKDINSAIAMKNYYSTGFVYINGRKVYLRFSRHNELHNPQPVNKILLVTFHNPYNNSSNPMLQQQMAVIASQYDSMITTDYVYQIFAPYGPVEKIVVLTRNVGVQALVQFSTVEVASTAKQYLQSQSVFMADAPIYYVLDIQFSNLSDLNIQKNSNKTKDFTKPLVLPHHPAFAQAADVYGYGYGYPGQGQLNQFQQYDQRAPPMGLHYPPDRRQYNQPPRHDAHKERDAEHRKEEPKEKPQAPTTERPSEDKQKRESKTETDEESKEAAEAGSEAAAARAEEKRPAAKEADQDNTKKRKYQPSSETSSAATSTNATNAKTELPAHTVPPKKSRAFAPINNKHDDEDDTAKSNGNDNNNNNSHNNSDSNNNNNNSSTEAKERKEEVEAADQEQ